MKSSKKLSLVLAVQMALAVMLPVPAQEVHAVKTEELCNIVLFATPDDSVNFMADYSEKIQKLCNDETTFHSLAGYTSEVSYGQLHVTSYFPQLREDGVIEPYKLASPSYPTPEQYAVDMLQHIQIPKDTPLDGNGDGLVDNVLLIVDGHATSAADPLWAKMFNAAGMTINGVPVGAVNIHSSYQVFENIISGGEGELCHEFMHSIGYPDLYRHGGRTGTPVGMWDVMASNSVFVQYPLAYQRATVSGWLSSRDIRESGSYSLAPVSAREGDRLFLLKTPLSETEFFAVEYRRQGARYSQEMDVKIPGTGLCIYRVNTEINGNYREDGDQLYVFRPGETVLDAGEGDMSRSNYGGTNAPAEVGSLDLSAGIADGALVYSNGTNSGIRISDIVLDEKSASFRIEFAEVSAANLWESVSTSTLSGQPCDMVNAPDGTVWLLTSDRSKACFYKLQDGKLTQAAALFGAGGANSLNDPKLLFCGDTPYLLYKDQNFALRIRRYDAAKSAWTELCSVQEMVQYADFATDGKLLYIGYTIGSFPFALHATQVDPATGKMTDLKAPASNVCNLSVTMQDGAPVIGYRDMSAADAPVFAVYRDGVWTTIAGDGMCSGVSAVSDGAVWAAPWGAGNGILRLQDGKLTSYPLPGAEQAFMQIPLIVDGQVCAVVNGQNPDSLVLYALRDGKWEQQGDIIAREIVNGLCAAGANGYLYCAFYTGNGTPVVKMLRLSSAPDPTEPPTEPTEPPTEPTTVPPTEPPTEPTTVPPTEPPTEPTTVPPTEPEPLPGDVNDDGVFDQIDLKLVQDYLLKRKVKLTVPERADFNQDGVVDVFDLAAMKAQLLKK